MSDSTEAWRIKRLIDASDKAGGDADLGRLLGHKSGAHVGHMRYGRRPITEKTVQKIEALRGYANWFDPPVEPVATPIATAPVPAYHSGQPTPYISVPLLANSGSMGHGSEEVHEDVMQGELQLSSTWLRREVRPSSPGALRFIHAYGESMDPTFRDGDVLLVDTAVRDPSSIDGVYVLRAHGRLFIKRVRSRMDGQLEVSSDNPTVKTVDLLNGTQQIDVAGRVIWVWNGRKL